MPRKPRTPPRPRDLNELAHHVGRIATHEIEDDAPPQVSEGASKRGAARAAKLTPAERKEIARKAALARWGKDQNG
jgi:hypothetical protein